MMNAGGYQVTAFLVDAANNICSWSQQCEDLFGYPAEEVMQRSYTFLFSSAPLPDDRPQQQLAADTASLDTELIRRDGARVSASIAVLPQKAADGTLNSQVVLISTTSPVNHKQQLQAFIDSLPGPFYVMNREGRFLLWNKKLERLAGRSGRQIAEANALDFFDERDHLQIEQKIRDTLEHGHSVAEINVRGKDGRRIPHLLNCSRIIVEGEPCICGMGIDITKRKNYEEMLHLRERAIEASVNGVIITRCSGKDNLIEYVNPAFEKITGYQAHEVLGRDPRFMRVSDIDQQQTRAIRAALDANRSVHVVLRNVRKNGELFWNDLKIDPVLGSEGEVTHFVAVITDVTEAKQSETQLTYLASHDPLTGLANRTLMREHLEHAVMHAHRHRCLLALVFIDLDKFKYINDTLGHDVGDKVLTTVASRLRATVRESDIVARIGGDEFVVVLASQPNMESITDLVDRLHRSIAEAMPFISEEISVTVSAGISVYPHDGTDVDTLIRHADAAMYHAKSQGRNNYQFYSAKLHTNAQKRLTMEMELRSAIEQDQLFLLFQPTMDLRTGKIAGAEALVRWRHPEHGVLMPDAFIPLAEDTGLIIPLGEWVVRQACGTLKQLHAAGFSGFPISINLSVRQLRQKEFAERLGQQLAAAGLPPASLELELTESQLMSNPASLLAALEELKSIGVKLAIDDFGTGYSSLPYLQKFPFDHIKIDRSFVHDIEADREYAVITKAVIVLGHNLNIRVVAEGVETEGQYTFLRDNGCDELQGYYFSEPLVAGPLQTLLRQPAQSQPP